MRSPPASRSFHAYCSFRNAGPPGPNEDAAGEEFYTALHFLFKKGSIGTRNVYLRAVDSAGMDSGWKQVGTWTVYLNEPPRSVAVAPGAGSGMSQTFVAEVSDPNGAIDVRNIFLQFSVPGEQRVCQVRASISDVVRLYLLADDNQSWLPAAYAGSAEIRQNSQCGFLASGAVTAKSGNTVTLTLPMVFMPGFAGTKAITLSTYDLSNVSNVMSAGTWTVPQSSCAYSFEAGTAQAAPGETKATIKVATGEGCPWLASTTALWITVTSNQAGSGPATISYTVLTNPTTAQRSASLMIGGASFVVTQAGRATALEPPRPTGWVVNGATFRTGMASSTFVTIWGTNLAPVTRTWDGSDFVNGKLPTRVEGVSATFNGKPGYPCFISPTQLNVITPEEDGQTTATILVSTPAGNAPYTLGVPKTPFDPAFFMFDAENRKYLAAVHTDGTYAGKPGLLGAAPTRPAKPGDILMLFGTGFGSTNPPCPGGELLGQPCRLANPVTIKFGTVAAVVDYAGTSGHLGFDQFNVVVPNVPDGDHAVTAQIGGATSPPGTYVTVKK